MKNIQNHIPYAQQQRLERERERNKFLEICRQAMRKIEEYERRKEKVCV